MDATRGLPTPRGRDLRALFDDLTALIEDPDGLGAATQGMGDDALLDLLRHAEAVGRAVDAVRMVAAGEVAHRSRPSLGSDRLSARMGCRTPAELVGRVTAVAGRTARIRIAQAGPVRGGTSLGGERLPGTFPLLRRALESGLVGLDTSREITSALQPALDHGAPLPDVWAAERALVSAVLGMTGKDGEDGNVAWDLDEDLDAVVDALRPRSGSAVTLPSMAADDVAVMAKVWALHLDPDGALPDEGLGMRRRGLTLGVLRNGTVSLRGELLPEVAAQLQRLFDAHLNPRVASHGNAGQQEARAGLREDAPAGDGSLPVAPPDPRSPLQLRHDALADILRTAAGCADTPSLGGAPPTLLLSVSADQLGEQEGVAFLEGAHSYEGDVVGSAVARQIACSGAVQKVVMDDDGRILALGSPLRTFTSHQRRAIALRDGGCVVPGCQVPATWCEVHHVHEHSQGGATHTDNGVLLCWFHHRTLETSGWEIRMVGGTPQVRAPAWIDSQRRWSPASGSTHRQWRHHEHRGRKVQKARRAPRLRAVPADTQRFSPRRRDPQAGGRPDSDYPRRL